MTRPLQERLVARARRVGVRFGLGGGPSAFTRVAYLAPREVVLVTGRHGDDEALWPVDWHMPAGLEPPRYCLSFAADGEGARLVLAAGALVVNFIGAAHEATILNAGARSGRDGNKRVDLGLEARNAVFVNAPVLAIAEGWLECRVEHVRPLEDRHLVLARVVHAEVAAPSLRLHHAWRRP